MTTRTPDNRPPDEELAELLTSGRLPAGLVETARAIVAEAGDTSDVRDSMREILAGYLRHPEWEPAFEAALTEDPSLPHLLTTAGGLVAASTNFDELRIWLNAFHLVLRSQNRERHEDVIMELLDDFYDF